MIATIDRRKEDIFSKLYKMKNELCHKARTCNLEFYATIHYNLFQEIIAKDKVSNPSLIDEKGHYYFENIRILRTCDIEEDTIIFSTNE